MRLFVGVDVPEVRLEGAHLGTATAPAHLTVLFLGEVADAQVPELASAFQGAVRGQAPFALELSGVGAFPSLDRPRVAWIGVVEGAEALARLHDALLASAREVGIPADDRPFVAHFTVLRVRGAADRALVREWSQRHATTRFAQLTVDRLRLKESRLGPGPVVHRTLAELPLEGAPPSG